MSQDNTIDRLNPALSTSAFAPALAGFSAVNKDNYTNSILDTAGVDGNVGDLSSLLNPGAAGLLDGGDLFNTLLNAALQRKAISASQYSQLQTSFKDGNIKYNAKYDKSQYADMIKESAARNGVDPKFAMKIFEIESGFNPNATSKCGAKGLGQLMDATAKRYGVTNSYDPKQNIEASIRFMADLKKQFNGNPDLMAAAYNAGPGAVKKYGGSVPPYKETQNYVAKLHSGSTGIV